VLTGRIYKKKPPRRIQARKRLIQNAILGKAATSHPWLAPNRNKSNTLQLHFNPLPQKRALQICSFLLMLLSAKRHKRPNGQLMKDGFAKPQI